MMTTPVSARGLGRGLGALLDDAAVSAVMPGRAPVTPETHLPVGRLQASTVQPRRQFDEEALRSLSASIKAQGVIQPLLVRPVGANGMYEIVAGERRWRASQMAGLMEVPVIIRELEDGRALEMALVENVQRADLNPIDEASGYLRLVNEFNYTHEDMARVTGKSRSHITNLLRLLALPEKLKECVGNGLLTMGHARALLGVTDDEGAQLRLANRVIKNSLSVRDTEDLVRRHNNPPQKQSKQAVDLATKELEDLVSRSTGCKVQLRQKAGVGQIVIRFGSPTQMTQVLKRLGAS